MRRAWPLAVANILVADIFITIRQKQPSTSKPGPLIAEPGCFDKSWRFCHTGIYCSDVSIFEDLDTHRPLT
jgi:hypothetical protein